MVPSSSVRRSPRPAPSAGSPRGPGAAGWSHRDLLDRDDYRQAVRRGAGPPVHDQAIEYSPRDLMIASTPSVSASLSGRPPWPPSVPSNSWELRSRWGRPGRRRGRTRLRRGGSAGLGVVLEREDERGPPGGNNVAGDRSAWSSCPGLEARPRSSTHRPGSRPRVRRRRGGTPSARCAQRRPVTATAALARCNVVASEVQLRVHTARSQQRAAVYVTDRDTVHRGRTTGCPRLTTSRTPP